MLKKEILFTLIMKNYMRNVIPPMSSKHIITLIQTFEDQTFSRIFVNLFKKIFADHNTNLSLFNFLFIFYYHINGP